MVNLTNYLPFVNEQIDFHKRMVERFEDNPRRKSLHRATSQDFSDLAEAMTEASKEIEELRQRPDITPSAAKGLLVSMEEIEGLPPELVEELSVSDADMAEFAILDMIEERGGIVSLDHIVIGLYRLTGEVHKRASVTSKIYRMTQKGILFNVPGKKGVYSSTRLTTEDAERILGAS